MPFDDQMFVSLQLLIFQQPLSSPFHLERLASAIRWYSAQKVRKFSTTAPSVIETLWAEVEHRSGCAVSFLTHHVCDADKDIRTSVRTVAAATDK